MSIQHHSNTHAAPILGLLACMLAISIWSASSSNASVLDTLDTSRSTAAQCLSQDDILAAQDRSRNGISLSCNSQIAAERVAR